MNMKIKRYQSISQWYFALLKRSIKYNNGVDKINKDKFLVAVGWFTACIRRHVLLWIVKKHKNYIFFTAKPLIIWFNLFRKSSLKNSSYNVDVCLKKCIMGGFNANKLKNTNSTTTTWMSCFVRPCLIRRAVVVRSPPPEQY